MDLLVIWISGVMRSLLLPSRLHSVREKEHQSEREEEKRSEPIATLHGVQQRDAEEKREDSEAGSDSGFSHGYSTSAGTVHFEAHEPKCSLKAG